MILLTGGTGNLGRHLIPLLLERGETVRVLSRNPQASLPDGCELVVGDIRDRAAVANAVEGCTTVISATHGIEGGHGAGPEAVDARGNASLIGSAEKAGVRRFVLMSAQGASPDSALSLMRAKASAEARLMASSLDWLIVRPALYLDTWLYFVVGEKVPAGGPALVLGKGGNPITFVSIDDVAHVVVRALDDGVSRMTLDVTGPANYTLTDLAKATGATKIKQVPRGALGVMRFAARPFAPAFARKAAMALELDTKDQTAPLATGTPTPKTTLQDLAASLSPANVPR